MINIVGIGTYLPEKILTNADLEKMVETSDQWILERTGIRERHIAESGGSSDLAAKAALNALIDAAIQPSEIDLIIVATMSPDMISPSTACLVQKKIGADRAVCFDIGAACSGFVFAMDVAKKFLESNQYQTALVIGAEKLSSLIDWKDRGTCILFGDGAGAAVLSKKHSGHEVLDIFLGSDGGGSESLKIPAGGSLMPATHQTLEDRQHFIKMDGKEVYKRAIDVMSRISEETVHNCGLEISDIKLFIPHQANKRIIDAVAKKLNMAEEKVFINVDRCGNTSAASIILALNDARAENRIQQGDYVLIVVFGAGFTWGGCIVQW